MTPLNVNYKEVEFTEFGIVATNTEYQPITFKLNGVECGVIEKELFGINDFSSTCLNALKDGMNSFDSTEKNVLIHEIYIGFRYKPANCEK
ncbi:hypothetical protein AUJ84_03900 [Candidatus Pacearchaeota archaeon CG1_02_32_132]|nr:MAG: hypothetical protein AUJ84_03900 [Candidatus Pacearchaeota archaeon CG1_02_32_132]